MIALVRGSFEEPEYKAFLDARSRRESERTSFRTVATVAQRQFFDNTVASVKVGRGEFYMNRAVFLTNTGLSLRRLDTSTTDDVGRWFESISDTVDSAHTVQKAMSEQVATISADVQGNDQYVAGLNIALVITLIILVLAITAVMARSLVRPLRRLRGRGAGGRRPAGCPRSCSTLRESGERQRHTSRCPPIGVGLHGRDRRGRPGLRRGPPRGRPAGGRGGPAAQQRQRDVRQPLPPQPDPGRAADHADRRAGAGRAGRRPAGRPVQAGPPGHPHAPQQREPPGPRRPGAARAGGASRSSWSTSSAPRCRRSRTTSGSTSRCSRGISVAGQAVNDVVHLVAELVENAHLVLPARDTKVTVSSSRIDGGGAHARGHRLRHRHDRRGARRGQPPAGRPARRGRLGVPADGPVRGRPAGAPARHPGAAAPARLRRPDRHGADARDLLGSAAPAYAGMPSGMLARRPTPRRRAHRRARLPDGPGTPVLFLHTRRPRRARWPSPPPRPAGAGRPSEPRAGYGAYDTADVWAPTRGQGSGSGPARAVVRRQRPAETARRRPAAEQEPRRPHGRPGAGRDTTSPRPSRPSPARSRIVQPAPRVTSTCRSSRRSSRPGSSRVQAARAGVRPRRMPVGKPRRPRSSRYVTARRPPGCPNGCPRPTSCRVRPTRLHRARRTSHRRPRSRPSGRATGWRASSRASGRRETTSVRAGPLLLPHEQGQGA